MTTTFNRMDVVMVKDHLADDWHLGLVNRDFNPGDFGVICEAKTSPNCSSFMAGVGFPRFCGQLLKKPAH